MFGWLTVEEFVDVEILAVVIDVNVSLPLLCNDTLEDCDIIPEVTGISVLLCTLPLFEEISGFIGCEEWDW